jgi:hypothetical protein
MPRRSRYLDEVTRLLVDLAKIADRTLCPLPSATTEILTLWKPFAQSLGEQPSFQIGNPISSTYVLIFIAVDRSLHIRLPEVLMREAGSIDARSGR